MTQQGKGRGREGKGRGREGKKTKLLGGLVEALAQRVLERWQSHKVQKYLLGTGLNEAASNLIRMHIKTAEQLLGSISNYADSSKYHAFGGPRILVGFSTINFRWLSGSGSIIIYQH